MSNSIFLLQGNDELFEMNEQAYNSEDLLQGLLANYPQLLAGAQGDGSSSRLLLVRREMGVPGEDGGGGRWALDHLFLDQHAVPTLVEVKRSTDTRLRREVVGQMLDYAANAIVYWPVDDVRASFEQTCAERGKQATDELAEFLGADADPADFWQQVKTNLQAGRIRMIFVADLIPTELRRVVEFLNEQMDPAEVLAVEIRQYQDQAGSMRTLVPQLVGQTAEAEKRKGTSPRPARQWDEASFFEDMQRRGFHAEAKAARALLDAVREGTGTGNHVGQRSKGRQLRHQGKKW